MTRYATRDQAIAFIVECIEAGDATRAEFDIEAIADAVLSDWDRGYIITADTEEFWAAVERHAL